MPGPIAVTHPAERDLALVLDAFDHVLAEAYERRAPNLIADHAFRLAQAFARFYGACPVLAAPDGAARASRLAIASTTLHQLELALDVLGIATPERM
jgi:arginyl-tRNA synthetase